jgi:hypothetical protein
MKKRYLNPNELNTPRFYSHAVAVEEAKKLVYVSGQVSWDAGGKIVGKGDMRAQSEQVFRRADFFWAERSAIAISGRRGRAPRSEESQDELGSGSRQLDAVQGEGAGELGRPDQ